MDTNEEVFIDYSQYQGANFDLATIMSSQSPRVYGGIMRSTLFTSAVDREFFKFWDLSKRVGLRRGVYHLARFRGDPIEQARWHHAMVGPLQRTDLFSALDFEEDFNKGELKGTPSKERCAWIKTYDTECRRLTGRRGVLYTGAFVLGDAAEDLDMYLWLAQYTSTIRWLPTQFKRWDMWQYRGDGGPRFEGILVDVDRNITNGGREAFDKLVEDSFLHEPSYELLQNNPYALQRGLSRAGFDLGTVDGKFGPKSKAALKKFLDDNGLDEGDTHGMLLSDNNTEHLGTELYLGLDISALCDISEFMEPFGFGYDMCVGNVSDCE